MYPHLRGGLYRGRKTRAIPGKSTVRTDNRYDRQIAANLLPYICDGATLQLGVGSMPNAVGEILAESDLKDLGMHTELCTDALSASAPGGQAHKQAKDHRQGKGSLWRRHRLPGALRVAG